MSKPAQTNPPPTAADAIEDEVQEALAICGGDAIAALRITLIANAFLEAEVGVFCGKYMTDTRKEFPDNWFKNAKLSPAGRDCSLNYFAVNASRPLSEWRAKGWLHPDDPRGWFQWYCRYYMGRRIPEEDRRQIRRWKAFRRHINQIKMNCEPGDPFCRPRQWQALLHWAYDSRKI